MKRLVVLVAFIVAVLPAVLTAQAVGGGISVYVPMDLFQGNTASISFETSLETSIGIGKLISVPIGFAYNQVYGAGPLGDVDGETVESEGPWFYADSLLPYIMLKATVPAGPLYVEAFGGGAMNYNFSLRPLHDRIAKDLRRFGAIPAGADGSPVAVTDLDIESGIGWGWVAGAGAGVNIGDISVGLSATYRRIVHPLRIRGRAFTPAGADEFDQEFDSDAADFAVEDLRVLLHGISIGIGGSFSF